MDKLDKGEIAWIKEKLKKDNVLKHIFRHVAMFMIGQYSGCYVCAYYKQKKLGLIP